MNLFQHQLLLGTIMIVCSVLIHVAGLVFLAKGLKRFAAWVGRVPAWAQSILLLTIGMLAIIALHMTEALAWAIVYLQHGEFEGVTKALYFSVTTSTTLGYGDITLSPQWQLLSTFEAIGGLLLYGASTAFLLGLMKNLFDDTFDQKDSKKR